MAPQPTERNEPTIGTKAVTELAIQTMKYMRYFRRDHSRNCDHRLSCVSMLPCSPEKYGANVCYQSCTMKMQFTMNMSIPIAWADRYPKTGIAISTYCDTIIHSHRLTRSVSYGFCQFLGGGISLSFFGFICLVMKPIFYLYNF